MTIAGAALLSIWKEKVKERFSEGARDNDRFMIFFLRKQPRENGEKEEEVYLTALSVTDTAGGKQRQQW